MPLQEPVVHQVQFRDGHLVTRKLTKLVPIGDGAFGYDLDMAGVRVGDIVGVEHPMVTPVIFDDFSGSKGCLSWSR